LILLVNILDTQWDVTLKKKKFCPTQHYLIGYYNQNGACLLCGVGWVFKQDPLCFILKGLNTEGVLVLTQHMQE